MASKPVALLLADLGVTKSHSRPHCSNDNPYSEAHFKTLKYRPEFPGRFGSIEDGRAFCQRFFRWYNHQHRHSGLGFHTQPPSTSATPTASRSSANVCSELRTPLTLNVLFARRQYHRRCPDQHGSTNLWRSRHHSNYRADRSHQG